MVGTEVISTKEIIQPQHYSAIFLLPAYPYPQGNVSGLEGVTERLVWRAKKAPKKWGLAPDTQLRIIATALVSRFDSVDRVVCMSGSIRTWMTETYADLMEKQLRRLEPTITILKEKESVGLPSEIKAIAAITSKDSGQWKVSPKNPIGIVADSEQIERIQRDIERVRTQTGYFPDYKIIPADEVLQQEQYLSQLQSPFEKNILRNVVKKYVRSPYWTTFWRLREWLAKKSGKYTDILSRATRKK